MKFSIITPSLRQLPWLKRCLRSVADQGEDVEHIVQDGGSGPELEAWMRGHPTARLFVEPDTGIYDALNRGFDRATGDICAWLNCDEQYLPGTLRRVARAFAENPAANFIVGDFLVLAPDGRLLAARKVTPPRRTMILTDHLYAFTCAMFFRRKVFADGLRFDATLQSVADGDWVCRALAHGHRFALVHEYLSTFVFTGENRSQQPVAHTEHRQRQRALPIGMRLAGSLLRPVRQFEKLLAGAYMPGPVSYEIYAGEDDEQRTRFTVKRPPFRYPGG